MPSEACGWRQTRAKHDNAIMKKTLILAAWLMAAMTATAANNAVEEGRENKSADATEAAPGMTGRTADSGEKDKQVKAFVENGKLHFATKGGKFHWWLDNRIYIDAAGYMPDKSVDDLNSKPNKDLETDDGKFRFSNGVIVRRARMAVKATLYEKWFAEFDIDYAYDEVTLKDMYIGYKFKDNLFVKVGQFKEPMSMLSGTSSKYLQSLERPMPIDAFASGRHLGASLTAYGNHWWASGGVFGQKVDILQKERNRGSDGYAFTARAAISPVNNENTTVHIGGYITYRTPDGNGLENRMVEFRALPESEVDHRRFVDAEIENVNHYCTLGYELGFRHRKFLAYGEYVFTSLNRYGVGDGGAKFGLKNATFNGWYANASYMILGQARRYSPDEAEFGPMPVRRKGGNLEIAARFSTINMNDFHDARAVITGGKADAYSLSLNWYPVSNVMLGVNYVYVNNDKYADNKGHITYKGKALSEAYTSGVDFSLLQARLMISF